MSNEEKETSVASTLPDLDNMTAKEAENVIEGMKRGGNKPEDLAAAFFSMEYPRFVRMVHSLSHNQLVRLCVNLAGNEFVPDKNKLKSDEEKKAFYLGNEMVMNRAIMRLHVEWEKAEEAQKMLDEQQTKKEGEVENVQEQKQAN